MTSPYDLHCHSTASDGVLSPVDLVHRAATHGVHTLSLTDHDTVDGIAAASKAAARIGLTLIPGVEISVTWNKKCFHVLGLDIDSGHPSLCQGLAELQALRMKRAEQMGDQLEKHGIPGAFAAVRKMAGKGMITRTHFARFLVARDFSQSVAEVFEQYLVRGKPGYVNTYWAELETALDWIHRAGGIAVLAHPLRYRLTASWLRRFLSAFQSAGGAGIEVVNGNSTPEQIATCADYARRYRLRGSLGSDFHDPTFPWVELGRLAPLPAGVEPVWTMFKQG